MNPQPLFSNFLRARRALPPHLRYYFHVSSAQLLSLHPALLLLCLSLLLVAALPAFCSFRVRRTSLLTNKLCYSSFVSFALLPSHRPATFLFVSSASRRPPHPQPPSPPISQHPFLSVCISLPRFVQHAPTLRWRTHHCKHY